MPTSKRRKNRSPKPAALPAKSDQTTAKIVPAPAIQPPGHAVALPALAEMGGNGREIDLSDLSDLSPRQQAALPIVACVPTIAQAAREAGVGETTLRRWLNDPAFSSRLSQLRLQSLNVARQKLLELTPLSISVLADSMCHSDPSIRLRAANYALSLNLRAAEIETLHSKLARLESTAGA